MIISGAIVGRGEGRERVRWTSRGCVPCRDVAWLTSCAWCARRDAPPVPRRASAAALGARAPRRTHRTSARSSGRRACAPAACPATTGTPSPAPTPDPPHPSSGSASRYPHPWPCHRRRSSHLPTGLSYLASANSSAHLHLDSVTVITYLPN